MYFAELRLVLNLNCAICNLGYFPRETLIWALKKKQEGSEDRKEGSVGKKNGLHEGLRKV